MKTKRTKRIQPQPPKKNMTEDEFADWVESKEGRAYIAEQSENAPVRGLSPRARAILGKQVNVLISIRLSEADLDTARTIAAGKGLPYQTYIKMLLHEALAKEAVK